MKMEHLEKLMNAAEKNEITWKEFRRIIKGYTLWAPFFEITLFVFLYGMATFNLYSGPLWGAMLLYFLSGMYLYTATKSVLEYLECRKIYKRVIK